MAAIHGEINSTYLLLWRLLSAKLLLLSVLLGLLLLLSVLLGLLLLSKLPILLLPIALLWLLLLLLLLLLVPALLIPVLSTTLVEITSASSLSFYLLPDKLLRMLNLLICACWGSNTITIVFNPIKIGSLYPHLAIAKETKHRKGMDETLMSINVGMTESRF